MRKLVTKDAFELSRLIIKLNLKQDLKSMFLNMEDTTDTESVGFDMIFTILEKASENKTESAIYQFLSGPFEMTADEVENLDLTEFVDGIFKIADVEKWKGLFQFALK